LLASLRKKEFLCGVPPINGGQHSMLDPAPQAPQGLNVKTLAQAGVFTISAP